MFSRLISSSNWLPLASALLISGACTLPLMTAAAAGPVNGPLGAAPGEIAALYGPVLRHNARVWHHQILDGGTVIDGDLYAKNGFIIRVVYHGGQAVLLEYTRADRPLVIDDVNTILASMASGSSWEQGKENTETVRSYHRADGQAIAHYTAEHDGSLLVAAEGTALDSFTGGRLLQ